MKSSRLDAIYERAFLENRPVSVLWELNYDCNLECRHCYVEPDDKATLTLDQIEPIMDDLASSGVLFIVFTGGEVLCRSEFVEILRAASRREFAFRILTNATLLDAGTTAAISELKPVSVDVSLYGDRDAHDMVTGVPGSHKKTMHSVALLIDSGVNVQIKLPLMKTNVSQLEFVRRYAEAIGAPLVIDMSMVCRPSGDPTPLDEQIDEEGMAELLRILSGGKPVQGGSNMVANVPFCSAGRSTARITPSGDLTPCVAIPDVLGSLLTSTFDELWNSTDLDRIRQMRLDDLPECMRCELRESCIRCPGQALVEDGDLSARSSAACRMARVVSRLSSAESKGPAR